MPQKCNYKQTQGGLHAEEIHGDRRIRASVASMAPVQAPRVNAIPEGKTQAGGGGFSQKVRRSCLFSIIRTTTVFMRDLGAAAAPEDAETSSTARSMARTRCHSIAAKTRVAQPLLHCPSSLAVPKG